MPQAPITVFFRDDDVGQASPSLRGVMGVLIEEGIPCNYQVVPEFLDEEGARFLREIQSKHPQLVALNQHGYRHQQQIDGRTVWSEFAGGRPYEEQLADIRAGRAELEQELGASFDGRIFTPPCHKYDEATIRALHEAGFEILSAGVKIDPFSQVYYALGRALGRIGFLGKRVSYHGQSTPNPKLAEVSVSIDVDEEKGPDGQRIEKDLGQLWREFEACRRRTGLLGIMLHHQCYERPERLDVLRSFVRRLKAEPGVVFSTLHAIAASRCPRSPAEPQMAAGAGRG